MKNGNLLRLDANGSKLLRQWFALCVAVVVCCAASVASAVDPVTLPALGVDVSGYVTAAVTAIGTIILAVIGGYFAIKAFGIGMKWVGRMIGGRA
jgi:hypothetical protein